MHVKIATEHDEFLMRFPYHPVAVAIVKGIPGRKWNAKKRAWTFPATPAAAGNIMTTLKANNISYTPDQQFVLLTVEYAEGQLAMVEPENVELPDTKTTMFDHQRIGLAMFLKRTASYLAWEMGTGKSKPVCDLCEQAELKRVLIACPTSVIDAWPTQFDRHTDGYRCLPLRKGSVRKRKDMAVKFFEAGPGAVVINHEAVWREPFGSWALQIDWDAVVVDEAHRISESRTKVSSFFSSLRAKAKKRICLSGTPIPNTPLSLYGQMLFLDPGLFGKSFTGFRARYAVMGGYQGHEVVAFKNLDELHQKFYTVAHRITKAEALDLPETTDERMTFELSKEAQKIYEQVEGNFKTEVKAGTITASNALTELLRLQQITGGAVGTDEGNLQHVDEGKKKLLVEYLTDLDKSEPVSVFCRFHHDLDAVRDAAQKAGRKVAELSGRRNELAEWQKPDGPTVLAVQIQSGGVGVDMTRAAYGVYYSLGFSFADYAQSRARLDRQGQERSVTFTHLIAEGTVDEKVYQVLQKKGNVIEEILKDLS